MAKDPEMAPEDGPQKPRRLMRVLLVCSLALNLLVIGLVAGAVLRKDGFDRRMPPQSRDLAMVYTRALSDDDRRALRREMRSVMSERRRGGRQAILEGYGDAVALLRSAPFDEAAWRSLLEAQSQSAREMQNTGQKVLADHVVDMTDEERAAFADRLERAVQDLAKRGPGRPGGPGGGPGGKRPGPDP